MRATDAAVAAGVSPRCRTIDSESWRWSAFMCDFTASSTESSKSKTDSLTAGTLASNIGVPVEEGRP